MTAHRPPRQSDSWVTPWVIVAGLLVAGAVMVAAIAAVTLLTARGIDPDPMLRLTAQIGTAVTSTGTFLLTVLGRKATTRVERNTGVLASNTSTLASGVYEAVDRLDELVKPVPPARRPPVPSAYPETVDRSYRQ